MKFMQNTKYIATIFIDAGHGGHDPGAVGHGLREKDVALEVAKRLGAKLIALGFRVVYSRINDTFVPLNQIANLANISHAVLFLSVHCNAASNPNAYGFETFHYPGAVGGKKMADLVQSAISSNTKLYQVGKPNVNRGTKTAYYTVLTNTAMEAILVEMAFISNKEDNTILRTQQEGFAEALTQAVCNYFGVENKPIEEELPEPQDVPKDEDHWGYPIVVELNEMIADYNKNNPDDEVKGISELRLDEPPTRAEMFRIQLDTLKMNNK